MHIIGTSGTWARDIHKNHADNMSRSLEDSVIVASLFDCAVSLEEANRKTPGTNRKVPDTKRLSLHAADVPEGLETHPTEWTEGKVDAYPYLYLPGYNTSPYHDSVLLHAADGSYEAQRISAIWCNATFGSNHNASQHSGRFVAAGY